MRSHLGLVISLVSAAGVLSGVGYARQSEALAPAKYRNIQVLTDVPARQILPTMDYFAAATGSGCGDCHQRSATPGAQPFEIDTPRKIKAREMIRMVKAINAANYGVTVTCATCHAGHPRPAAIEMMTPERIASLVAAATAARGAGPGRGTPVAAAPAPEADARRPAVDAVLDRYFEAVGGRAALDALPPLEASATIGNLGTPLNAAVTIQTQGEKFVVSITIGSTPPSVIGFDGANAWTANGATVIDAADRTMQKVQPYAMPVVTPQSIRAYRNLTAELPQRLRLSPSAQPVAVNVIAGSHWPDVDERFYFDAATGLLLRRLLTTHVALGASLDDWVDFRNYQPFANVKLPREIVETTPSQITTLTISATKTAPVDDARFTRPKGGG